MRKHFQVGVAFLLGLLYLSLVIRFFAEPEPEYQGRPISYWMEQLRASPRSLDQLVEPFQAMGSEAVPYLVEELRAKESGSDRLWSSVYAKLPAAIVRRLPWPASSFAVRQGAALALEKIGPVAVPALIQCSNDPNPTVRIYSVRALARVRSRSRDRIAALIDRLYDPDPHVRAMAISQFGALAKEEPKFISLLVRALRQRGPTVQAVLAAALCELGPATLPPLTDALHRSDTRTQLAVISVLGGMSQKVPGAVGLLIAALELEHHHPIVRGAAAAALGPRSGDRGQVIAALSRAARDPHQTVRQNAVRSLGRLGELPDSTTAVLVQALQDSAPAVRLAAVYSLVGAPLETLDDATLLRFGLRPRVSLSGPAANITWKDLLTDPDPGVRRAAKRALSWLDRATEPR